MIIIEDLPSNEGLDSDAMARIAGGLFGFEGWAQTGAFQPFQPFQPVAYDQKPTISDFHFTSQMDRSSPGLFTGK